MISAMMPPWVTRQVLSLISENAAGKEIGPIVSGDSDLLIRTVFQIIVAVHLRCTEIYPPESGVSFVGDAWNKQLHGFIGSHHAAG